MRQGQRDSHNLGRADVIQWMRWLVSSVVMFYAASAHTLLEGQTMFWADTTPGGGSWLNPLNWRDHQPDVFYHFVVDNGGTAVVSEGLVQGSYGAIGSVFDGSVRQTGGRLELTSEHYPVTIGHGTDSTGQFDLLGGTALINTLHVGFQGEGEVGIVGGELLIGRELAIGSYGTGTGSVVQSGGVIAPATPEARPVLYVGRVASSSEPPRFDFLRGNISVADIGLQFGTFRQSGGELRVDEYLSLSALPDRPSTLVLDAGAYLTRVRHLEMHGSTIQEMSQVIQSGGFVQSNTTVKHGVYRLVEGLKLSDIVVIGDGGRWQSSGGISLANSVTVEGHFEPGWDVSEAYYEHANGLLRTNRLVLKTGTGATFSQTGGVVAVDNLDIGVSGPDGSPATYRFSGGQLHVDSLVRIGSDSQRGVFDFLDQPTVLDMGADSRLEFGLLASIVNGANATLRMGPGSVLISPPNVNLASLVGSFEHHNVVVHRPGQTLTINGNQSAFVGGLDLSAGLVVHGHAFGKAGSNSNVTSYGHLMVGPTGVAEFGPESFFGITNSTTAGVFGGTLDIEQIAIGPSGAAQFTVDSGLMHASDIVVGGTSQPTALIVRDGNLQANTVTVRGSSAALNQNGGQILIATQLHLTNRSRTSQSSGERYIGYTILDGQSTYAQSGGVTRTRRLSSDNAQIQLQGGELIVEGSVNLRNTGDRFDFLNSTASLQLDGAVFYSNSTTPFLRASNATFRADEHSLMIVPVGTSLENRFGTYDNRALMANINQSMTIPATREIHGQGDLAELGRLTIEGGLLADPGGGFEIYEFSMMEGSHVDLGRGTAYAVGGLGNSVVHGGTLLGGALVVDPSSGSEFVQAGGNVEFGVVDIRGLGKYKLHGGNLTVHGTLQGSTLDFGHSDATLVLGAEGYLQLDQIFVNGEENAHLLGQPGSLIVYDGLEAPNSTFADFATNGLLHSRGDTLEVPMDKRLGITGRFDGDLTNAGTVDPGSRLAKLEVAGNYRQESSGRLRLQWGANSDSDELSVSGLASLDGLLQIDFVDNFLPAVGDQIPILFASHIQGAFDAIVHARLPEGLDLQVRVDENTAYLHVTQLPPEFRGDIIDGDLDGNRQLDANDIDLLALAIRNTGMLGTFDDDSLFDINGSGRLDIDDLRTLVETKIGTRYGDANLDGRIDNHDFDVWNTAPFSEQIGWRSGDFNGDGLADVSDFNLWLSNRGWNAPDRLVVPEAINVLPWLSSLFMIAIRHRRAA